MDRELIDPKSHRQLFIDDHAVFKTVGIERTLHQPEDCGAGIRPDKSLGQTGTQTSSVPQWNSDKNLWEWWYYAHQIDGSPSLLLYSTSEDGIHWENPALGLHEWRGSKKNNIALALGSEHLAHIIRVGANRLYRRMASNGPCATCHQFPVPIRPVLPTTLSASSTC